MKFSLSLSLLSLLAVASLLYRVDCSKALTDRGQPETRCNDRETVQEMLSCVRILMSQFHTNSAIQTPASTATKSFSNQKRTDAQILLSLLRGLFKYGGSYLRDNPVISCALGLIGFHVALQKSATLRLFAYLVYMRIIDRLSHELRNHA